MSIVVLTRCLSVLVVLTAILAKEHFISIPVSISPIIQESSAIELSRTTRFFYQMDREFYSRVTVSDAARNEGKDISEIIKKSIAVVLLITASSRVSGSLTVNKLKYRRHSSKWSYQIPLHEILRESNGTITILSDKIPIYKIQEVAMKVLEKRYRFSVETILNKLNVKPLEFYAVDERQWIDVVGIITDHVIRRNAEMLNLTSCYLAELIGKHQKDMKAFTLDEVDTHLSNTRRLMEQLPAYRNATASSLFEAFEMTTSELANMSSTDPAVINDMGLKDLIKLLTTTLLEKFRLNEVTSSYQKPTTKVEIPCRAHWHSFRVKVVIETFENEARDMSVSSQTLASLVQVPHHNVKFLSVKKMLHLIKNVIEPLKRGKRITENYSLSTLKIIPGLKKLNIKKRNAISLIKNFAKFSKRHMRQLYGWTSHDYHFARLFSVADLATECSLDIKTLSLLSLARINVGELHQETNCQTFAALRQVWGKASLRDLRDKFYPLKSVPLDTSIGSIVSELTNSSTAICHRVLTNSPVIKWLLTKVTLTNLSMLTNYTEDYLTEIPIQRLLLIIHELQNAGSFQTKVNSDIMTINYSSNAASISFEDEILRMGKNYKPEHSTAQSQPTALPRSLSTRTTTGVGHLAALCTVGFILYGTVA